MNCIQKTKARVAIPKEALNKERRPLCGKLEKELGKICRTFYNALCSGTWSLRKEYEGKVSTNKWM